MSWHFLERWIEKANHHSTLVGKFWITFLIICRMVIVASIGDRVYSDEQSEFKCNTMQPGCTNICFNRFSPISHLRFWSFQILLVATPSVMFVIYSGHDQKGAKGGEKTKKSKKKIPSSERRQRIQAGRPAGNVETKPGRNNNANNNNNNNNNDNNSGDNQNKKSTTKTSPKRDLGRNDGRSIYGTGGRSGRGKGPRDSPTGNGEVPCRTQTPQVMATLIHYKNAEVGTPIEASIVDEKKESNVPWLELRCNSVAHLTENSSNKYHKNDNITSNLWKKPKDTGGEKPAGDRKKSLNADVVMWGFPSSDDDNRNGKFRKTNQSSLTEANIYRNAIAEAMPNEFEKEHELAMMSTQPPPEYPGNEWPQTELDDTYYGGKANRTKGFRIPGIELVKTRTKKAQFTRHFHLYYATVVARLALEIAFLVMQILLYGFTVPALYKCEQWPCPNVVDCFISRPMEKTIFLFFMFIYTCICVLLNACELKYLTWVYIFGRPKLRAKSKKYDQENGGRDIVYDANGFPKYNTCCSDQDSEFDECELAEIEDEEDDDAFMQNGYGNQFDRRKFDENRERGRRNAFSRGEKGRYKDKHLQEKIADMRRHELDLILNDEEMQDDLDLDLAQDDPADDMMEMEMEIQSHGSAGNQDNFHC